MYGHRNTNLRGFEAKQPLEEGQSPRNVRGGLSCSLMCMNAHTWSGKPLSTSQMGLQMRQAQVSSASELDCICRPSTSVTTHGV